MFWKFVIWMYKALSSWDEGLRTVSVQNDYSHGLIWKWRVKEYKSIHQWSRWSSGQHELRQAKCPRNMSPIKSSHDASPLKLYPDGAGGRSRCREGVLRPPPVCASGTLWTPSQGLLFLPDLDLPRCSGGSTTLRRKEFPDELLINADSFGKKSKQRLSVRNGNEHVIKAFRVVYTWLTSFLTFFIKMVFKTHFSKTEALQISCGRFFRKLVSSSDKTNVEKCPICSDTGCAAGTEHRDERQRKQEESSKAAEPRRGQGIWPSGGQHFLCKIGGKKISVLFWLWWKHNTRSSLVWPGCLHSCAVPDRDSQSLLSFTGSFQQHMSAYTSLTPMVWHELLSASTRGHKRQAELQTRTLSCASQPRRRACCETSCYWG